MSKQSEKLAEFGQQVLDIMEADKEWGSDTLEEISSRAYALDLAGSNEYHEFTQAS